MNPIDQSLKVFVSSTSEDLQDYRAVARQVILDMRWTPRMMEHFGAMPTPTVEACYEVLKECDLIVLIVAFRRGWVPTVEQGGNGQNSVTALELNYARSLQIPVLALLAQKNWPGDLWEDDAPAREWIIKFRQELNQPADFFDYESPTAKESERLPAFRAILRSNLVSHRERLLREQPITVNTVGLDQLDSATTVLKSGCCIPFLGQGIFGEGPFSTKLLIQELGDSDSREPCLATAAEYRERFLHSREGFLSRLEEIFGEQARQIESPAVHDLLAQIRPPLIISATEDLMLEERLDSEGKPPWILCHVIRSFDGEHDGKVLVFRGPNDDNPKFYPADRIDLSEAKDAYIIYKPLGSPFLNHRLNSDLDIDTVVITEADHLELLRKLANQSTRVPTSFSRYFQRYPLFFLGYPLDVWHYRLVLQVFQSIGVTSKSCNSLAVRVPASRMEELAWRRLSTDVLPMDPNDFARQICTKLIEKK